MGIASHPQSPRLVIEHVPIDQLTPDPLNARTHSPSQVRAIAKSISTFGMVIPFVVDGEVRIICGHGRLDACRRLGMAEVPVVRLKHLSEDQARAFQIADNRLTELGGWDQTKLAQTLKELSLKELSFDLDVVGFALPEIDFKIAGLDIVETKADPDDAPVRAGPAVTRLGDLWSLGGHRLLCGDALSAASYDLLMGDERAAVVFTDPPYNVRVQGHVGGRGKVKHREFAMASGEMSSSAFTAFLTTALQHCAGRSRPGGLNYVCMDWRHMGELMAAGALCYETLKTLCVWDKARAGQGSFYRSQHELVFVFKVAGGTAANNVQLGRFGRNRSNVWSYPSPAVFGRSREEGTSFGDHPCPKPVALVADALMDASDRGDIVLDPFVGGGSSLMAAERTGRVCRALELDPLYVDGVLRRFSRMSGQDPVRASDGASFAELEMEAEGHE